MISQSRAGRARFGPVLWVALGALTICVLSVCSLLVGAVPTDLATVWSAIFRFEPSETEQSVVRHLRLPRTTLALVAGCCLGVAGAITQGVTRNPLGGPGILGINACLLYTSPSPRD